MTSLKNNTRQYSIAVKISDGCLYTTCPVVTLLEYFEYFDAIEHIF